MVLDVEHTELSKHTPRIRNFNWEKTKTFYYVAKLGSFANAARFLNISQSALSRQISSLEDHLGCPLFMRHSGGIKTTRKGEELLAVTEIAYQGFKGVTQENSTKTCNGEKRKIRIMVAHSDAYIFNEFILEYNMQHPEIVFELVVNDQLTDIDLTGVDIAIRPYDSNAQRFQQEPLFTLEKKLYASLDYLEKYGEPQTVDELKSHRIIAFGQPELPSYEDINWILRLGKPVGEVHEPIYIANSMECLIGAANKGMGIIATYEKMATLRNSNLKRILPLVSFKEKEAYFVYPSYYKKDNEIMAIKKYLRMRLSS